MSNTMELKDEIDNIKELVEQMTMTGARIRHEPSLTTKIKAKKFRPTLFATADRNRPRSIRDEPLAYVNAMYYWKHMYQINDSSIRVLYTKADEDVAVNNTIIKVSRMIGMSHEAVRRSIGMEIYKKFSKETKHKLALMRMDVNEKMCRDHALAIQMVTTIVLTHLPSDMLNLILSY